MKARDRVDLFRPGDSAHPVATDAMVLGVTGVEDPLTGGLLLALPPRAAKTAVQPVPEGYAIVIRPSG
ncbi:hypothetical protein [Actinoplanes sp. N902-109]|uniref:hypothetical protein n=1 Tax=Actinoplanes sp. (strain N902-109) TaxID=649831 RepID=UPI0003295F29|nr:hypothetical protein [Actinoplanes sp. N902-109]AGL21101.1 hypothetical protein L083_7591 [Actinoplanes sp. N902-109]